LVASCKKSEPQGYRVVAYDGVTKQWTIIYSDYDSAVGTSHRKRFVVVCDSYKRGDHDYLRGPDVCDLQVGELIDSNSSGKGQDHIYIDVTDDQQLYIAQGEYPDDERTVQFFNILKYEMLPDSK